MKHQVILDTGPLAAAISQHDICHHWAVEQLKTIHPPLLTCEPVISEACFLLRSHHQGIRTVFEWLCREIIRLPFHLDKETNAVEQLIMKYADVPMSLADACLVRMSENYPKHLILTLDRSPAACFTPSGRKSADSCCALTKQMFQFFEIICCIRSFSLNFFAIPSVSLVFRTSRI